MSQQKALIDTPDSTNADDVKKIKVHIGVFFDGTGNNKLNIEEYLKRDKTKSWYKEPVKRIKWQLNDSYKRDYTNVARLFEAYDVSMKEGVLFYKIYIEGIATTPRKLEDDSGGTDSLIAGATGMGPYGINGKVERACELVLDKIKDVFDLEDGSESKIEVDKLYIDVFGFSRGAAAARRFISCLEKASGDIVKQIGTYISTYNVSLRNLIKKKNIKVNSIEPCFMGLFDTVSSYGFNFTDDVRELTLGVGKVKKVIQLVAADEYRENFSLTRIKSANSNGIELIIPGEHSDVGGGHPNELVEKTIIRPQRILYDHKGKYMRTVPIIYNGYKSLEDLLQEGWIKNENEKERTISNRYNVIPLLLMNSYATSLFVPNKVKNYKIPSDLSVIKNRIMQVKDKPLYVFSNTQPEIVQPLFQKGDADFNLIKNIRHDYLHLSAQGGLVNSPASNNIRLIIDDTQ